MVKKGRRLTIRRQNPVKPRVITATFLIICMCFTTLAPSAAAVGSADGFYHVSGGQIVDGSGQPVVLKGISFDNCQWGNPSSVDEGAVNDHDAESYFELAAMGMGHVRFDMNYGLFEDDSAPGVYKEEGFAWLDKNIAWAKAAGVRLILRMMHPQGGYQASSSVMVDEDTENPTSFNTSGGKPLWIDIGSDGKPISGGTNYQSLQQRLIDLWTAIAQRYADEPTIIGFDLVNEPVVPQLENKEATRNQWRDLAQRIANGIRTVDQNHIIFVECLITWFNADNYQATDWNHMSLEDTQVLIDDDNVVYEFHFYEPFLFTHQGADWLPQYTDVETSYPSGTVVDYRCSDWNSRALFEGQSIRTDGEWTYFEIGGITLTDDYNFLQLQASATGLNGGTVWFDDLQITWTDADGGETVVESHDFSGGLGQFGGIYFQYGGSAQWDGEVGRGGTGGSLKISGASGSWDNAYSWSQVFLDPGCTYKVSGWVKGGNGLQVPRVSCLYAENVWRMDKDYLRYMLERYLRFGEDNNVPMITEWGFRTPCCEESRGGAEYTRDLTALLAEFNLSSNYHAYHDKDFGLYPLPAWQERGERNEALYDILTTYFVQPNEAIRWATLTFMSPCKEPVSITQMCGSAVTPPELQREGYTFCGWDSAVPETMPEVDMTFTALWAETAVVTADGVRVDMTNREPGTVVAAGYDETGRMICVGLEKATTGEICFISGTAFAESSQVRVFFLNQSSAPSCPAELAVNGA